MQMPFGKYKGEEIEDIPEAYLRWLIDNIDLYSPLRGAVYQALDVPDPQKQLPAVIQVVYRKLSRKWHPDVGGSTEAMQAINEFQMELTKQAALPK